MISQDFKAHVPQESYVILGNDALVKCDIPSFVTDLVQIIGWTDSEGKEFGQTGNSNFGKFAKTVLELVSKIELPNLGPIPGITILGNIGHDCKYK